jgi:phosphotransferase system  glucose/maltose/N-acetylglucosamine-specific IIC component
VAALVRCLVFSNVLEVFGPIVPVDPACQGSACEMEHDAPNVGVLGGIIIGLVAAVL